MTNRRIFAAGASAASLAALLGSGSGLAFAQQGPGNDQNQASRFAQVLAGLINAAVDVVANVQVQNVLNNLLQNATFLNDVLNKAQILNLTDVLNGNEIHVLSDLVRDVSVLNRSLNNSTILSNFLNSNTVQNFLNNNNIASGDVITVGVNVLGSQPLLTFYTFSM